MQAKRANKKRLKTSEQSPLRMNLRPAPAPFITQQAKRIRNLEQKITDVNAQIRSEKSKTAKMKAVVRRMSNEHTMEVVGSNLIDENTDLAKKLQLAQKQVQISEAQHRRVVKSMRVKARQLEDENESLVKSQRALERELQSQKYVVEELRAKLSDEMDIKLTDTERHQQRLERHMKRVKDIQRKAEALRASNAVLSQEQVALEDELTLVQDTLSTIKAPRVRKASVGPHHTRSEFLCLRIS